MKKILKRVASKLPQRYQQEFKRIYFGHQIKIGKFKSDEKEFSMLGQWVGEGDWVLDMGANVGYYVIKLSELVGVTGRVIAFEPVPQTFELLAANIARITFKNVTLVNAAAFESTKVIGMNIPKFDTGLTNYYMAHLANESSGLQVLCLPVDCLDIPKPIKLAKIDVEGHELSVLKGMVKMLKRDHPILIVEDNSPKVVSYLKGFGYSSEKVEGSPNRIFR
jgi:FkbM family methyltransferase